MTEHIVQVRPFEHRCVAGRAEYRAAAAALERLAAAISDIHPDMTQDQWMGLASDLAWSLQLCDTCEAECCANVPWFPPARIDVSTGDAVCTYICRHGNQWERTWEIKYRVSY
jgi:hypothetical protein